MYVKEPRPAGAGYGYAAELAELSVFSAGFAARLRPIAGLRNVLVHGYLQVDLAIVEGVLKDKLGELEEFARLVEAYLARA